MKTEELEAKGLTQEQIDFVMAQNGKSLSKFQKKVEEQEIELKELKEKLEISESTLKGFEDADIEGLKSKIEEYEAKVAEMEKKAEQERYQRDYDDALKQELGSYTFSSESAKRDVIRQIKDSKLVLEDGKLLGLGDLIKKIKEADKGAFVDTEQAENEKHRVKGKDFTTGHKTSKGKPSLAQLMKMKNENPELNIDDYLN